MPRDPPVYKLKDYDGEEINGTFDKELQKVAKQDKICDVEKYSRNVGEATTYTPLKKG